MTLSPGSDAVKQNVASPALFVGAEPLGGVANVACAPTTLKTTVTPGVGLPEASLTVAVTQCRVPTVLVAADGVRVSDAGAPPRSWTNTSGAPLVSPGTRLVASGMKATKRPAALIEGGKPSSLLSLLARAPVTR